MQGVFNSTISLFRYISMWLVFILSNWLKNLILNLIAVIKNEKTKFNAILQN